MRLRTFRLTIAVAFLSVAASGLPASAEEPAPARQVFVCPIGGATFEQDIAYPHLALVQFPDASHMGDEFVDAQIPECPGNGLLILPEFSAEPASGEAMRSITSMSAPSATRSS